jgi:hypothetical protein
VHAPLQGAHGKQPRVVVALLGLVLEDVVQAVDQDELSW